MIHFVQSQQLVDLTIANTLSKHSLQKLPSATCYFQVRRQPCQLQASSTSAVRVLELPHRIRLPLPLQTATHGLAG